MQVRVLGIPELKKEIGRIEAKAAGAALTMSAKAGAEIVKIAASGKAPRRTGRLESDIVLGKTHRSATRAETEVGPGEKVFYGRYQELGVGPHHQPKRGRMHPGHAAQPFLRPALDESAEPVKEAVKTIFRRELGL